MGDNGGQARGPGVLLSLSPCRLLSPSPACADSVLLSSPFPSFSLFSSPLPLSPFHCFPPSPPRSSVCFSGMSTPPLLYTHRTAGTSQAHACPGPCPWLFPSMGTLSLPGPHGAPQDPRGLSWHLPRSECQISRIQAVAADRTNVDAGDSLGIPSVLSARAGTGAAKHPTLGPWPRGSWEPCLALCITPLSHCLLLSALNPSLCPLSSSCVLLPLHIAPRLPPSFPSHLQSSHPSCWVSYSHPCAPKTSSWTPQGPSTLTVTHTSFFSNKIKTENLLSLLL